MKRRLLLSGVVRALGLVALTAGLLFGCGDDGDGGNSSLYTISGNLTGLVSGTSVVLQNNGGDNLTLTKNGSFKFTQDVTSGQIYAVTVLTQPLHQICTVTSGSGTVSANVANVTISCAAAPEYAYVANSRDGTVSQYAIGADGALTPMTTPSVTAGSLPSSVTVDPSGRYAYVANTGDGAVSQYAIGAAGALTPMTQATVTTGSGPISIAVAQP